MEDSERIVGMSRSRFKWRRARLLGEEVDPGSRNGEGAIENRVEGRLLPLSSNRGTTETRALIVL